MRPVVAAAVMFASLLIGAGSQPAASVQQTDDRITQLTVTGSHSTLALSFEEPVAASLITKSMHDLVNVGTMTVEDSIALADELAEFDSSLVAGWREREPSGRSGGPSDANIHCNGSYGFSDSAGFFTIQRACRTSVAQWGYLLSPSTQQIIVGYVHEFGMDWFSNGIRKPRNAPHTEPKNYTFHGTFNPVVTGDRVDYNDVFGFRHNVGPGGEGTVTIYGGLNFRSS